MNFNKQQIEAINSIDGNISVIASAGSGKTTMLTYRIKNMIENYHCNPSSILTITFSRKAKESIMKKLEDLNITTVTVETFHSLALKIIIAAYGANKYKVWTAQWEKENFIQDICSSILNLCPPDKVPFNEIYSFIALQKINMRKPTEQLIFYKELPFSKNDMSNVYSLYEKQKEYKSYIEFDDFLNLANKVFDTFPDLLNYYQKCFQYVLADEFQDISLSQSLLLKKINNKNTMIVGDPLQAIYSFRGGDSKYILDFDTEYSNTKIINLNINYRCSNDIVHTANKLASSISDSKHKNYIESIANKPKHKIPELQHFIDDYKESEWIAKKINELIANGYEYNDIAILARTNAQLQKLESTLHNENIAFDIVDGKLFTDLPEIKLILSYLKLALDENDNEAFKYLYNKPNRWLNKKFLEEVENNSILKKTSLYNSMFTIDRRNWRFKNGIDEIFEVINYLQNENYSNVSDLVHYLRKRLDIDTFITKGKQADDGNYIEQIENLDSFENLCKKYNSIEQLIHYIDKLNKDMKIHKNQKVKLLTIHKSKGMEYPVVFIVGCNNGLLPHYKNQNQDDERKLLYVAITRAEKELYMSYVDIYNNKTMKISPFIESIKDTINIVTK